jgi:hypothetical protein
MQLESAPSSSGRSPSSVDRRSRSVGDHEQGGTRRGDRLVRQATTASVVLLAVIAAIVSYRPMHTLLCQHGEAAWTAAPLSAI